MNLNRSSVVLSISATLCAASIALMTSGCNLPPRDLSTPEAVERLYNKKCGSCHAAPAPHEYAPEDWPGIFDEFAPRANLRPDERPQVEAWVIERAKSALMR